MWNDEVLANHFEVAIKAIDFSISTYIIKIYGECIMRHYANMGWISENSGIRIYRGVREKIAIRLQGAPNLVHELYKRKASMGRINHPWNVLNDVKCSNKVK